MSTYESIPPFSRYGQGDAHMSLWQILKDSGYDPDVAPFPGLPALTKGYNAALFTGATNEAKITAAIAKAVADGKTYVWVPSTMLPYNAPLVTFNTAVRMVREGSDPTVYDVRAYGAAGDAVTDDTVAIQSAHDFMGIIPLNQGAGIGTVYFPVGNYLITTTIVITKRCLLMGEGSIEDQTAPHKSVILKKSNMTTLGLRIDSPSTVMKHLAVMGQNGNTGDGIQLRSNNITLFDCAAAGIGANGIRVGDDSNVWNTNNWSLQNVNARSCGGDGIYIHSDSTGLNVNANAGTAMNVSCTLNTGKGLHLKNAAKNTFVGMDCELNTGQGIYLDGGTACHHNLFLGGDAEGNGTADIQIQAACQDNYFLCPGNLGAFTDNGTRTQLTTTTKLALPQTHGISPAGEIAGNGPTGGSFAAGNACFEQLYGDSVGRILWGWKVNGPDTGLVPAQLVADSNTLYVASRDTAAGKTKLLSGGALAGYLLLDHQNSKLETNETFTAAVATAIPAGGTAGVGLKVSSTANFGVFFGSGAPTLSAAKGSLYMRSDGTTTNDRMYVNTNGGTTWTAVTTAA